MSIRRRLAKFPQEASRALGPLSAHEYQQLINMYSNTQWAEASDWEKRSFRSFSQSNEDGLLAAILEDLGTATPGIFIEMGIGNGTENNTLLLALGGWRGMWFGGEKLALDLPTDHRLRFQQGWIDLDNVVNLKNRALDLLGVEQVDVFSLDLDGNDFHFCQRLLEDNFRPTVWIQEYNAVFGPSVEWVMPPDNSHRWGRNNKFGASYASFVKLFQQHQYRPVVCSHNGANVFFVRVDTDFPFPSTDTNVWRPPRYFEFRHGHAVTNQLFAGLGH